MFGTSGIRGEVGTDVTAELALSIGRALAAAGYRRVVVGRDTRTSGPMLADAVSVGLRESGADCLSVGVASTPTVARSVGWLGADAGVVVTASHNPPSDNGLKLWNPSGQAFDQKQLAEISDRVEAQNYTLAAATDVGTEHRWRDGAERHVAAIQDACTAVDDLHAVVDVGNGTGGLTATALRELGATVTTMNAEPDGRFPSRPSEPTAESCGDLCRYVAATDADVGIAHDGDADRMMAVDETGEFVGGDRLLALFGRATAGDGDRVAAPLNTSRVVDDALESVGASVVRTKVGDAFVAERAAEPDVVFGGEPSGAWIWPDEARCPDGPLAACHLAELIDDRGPLADQLASIGGYVTRRENHRCDAKQAVVREAHRAAESAYDHVEAGDGIRVAVDDGWFLIRASGTEPLVRLTAEARDASRADELLEEAYELLDPAVARAD